MKYVRAKFKVTAITEYEGDMKKVELQPVTTGSEENKTFWRYTPSGKLEMTINGAAASMFVVGTEYYLDFSSANPKDTDNE
jgi:hypothetical protein